MTTLTIAIPYYSGRRYLRQAIDSVLAQDDPRWRLVICDDRGPEDGEELVSSYCDPRLRYIRNPQNLGMVGNWNRCLDAAETDLVTILHADDELLPNYCRRMLEAAERHPDAVGIYCRAQMIGPDGKRVLSPPDLIKRFIEPGGSGDRILSGEPAVRALARGNFIICPTMCYRMSLLGTRRFSSRWRFVQDLEFTTRLLLDGEALVGLRAAGYAYRRHPENATSKFTESLYRFEEERAFLNELASSAANRNWLGAARIARKKTVIKLHLLYRALGDITSLRPSAAWAKARLLATL
jgi:glycosyltransferase involved in cell wall biosynthesis